MAGLNSQTERRTWGKPGAARLGHILRTRYGLSDQALKDGLDRQLSTGERLGDLLVAMGQVSRSQVTAALAEQWGLDVVDPIAQPPDPKLLAEVGDLETYLLGRLLPWRRIAGATTYLTDNPQQAGARIDELSGHDTPSFFVVTSPAQFETAFLQAFGSRLVERAANRVPASQSVRGLTPMRVIALTALMGLMLTAIAEPVLTVMAVIAGLFLLNAGTTAMRLLALGADLLLSKGDAQRERSREISEGLTASSSHWRTQPKISILVPLYREGTMIPQLIRSLSALDYPRELLEVKFLLEEGDGETFLAIEQARLPAWISVLVVPPGMPRTKPRALNFALDFCNGDIVGVLDAEDQPDPHQLREVASALTQASPDVACAQCQLSYYNATENWITRCFHLEYSIWFDVLLRGFQKIGLPIPLGGTSVYFRRTALEALGGWDAHNVTEDADLGMRIARAGGRVVVLDSMTFEEANCRLWPWVRQRSRWLKGYILTWLSHMRDPVALFRDLGMTGFLSLNVLLLGGAVSYLLLPMFWLSIAGWVIAGFNPWHQILPQGAILPLLISLGIGQGVMLGCAALAMARRGMPGLLVWVPTLPVYWTLGAVAAWKAVFEVFAAPYYWDKTRHGISRLAREIKAQDTMT